MALCIALCAAIQGGLRAQPAIDWHTIDTGGGTSTGGTLTLSGTIGQSDPGTMTGDTLTVTGGFWFGPPAGNCPGISASTLEHSKLVICLTGPTTVPTPDCTCYDLNASGAVDLMDVALAQAAHMGP